MSQPPPENTPTTHRVRLRRWYRLAMLAGTGLLLLAALGFTGSYVSYLHRVYRSYKLSADLYGVEGGFWEFKERFDATREMFVQTESTYWNDFYNRRVVNPKLSGHGWGFHDDAPTIEPEPGVTRILCIGSSTVWEGYPVDLEHQLENLAPGRFEVIDAGVPGASITNLFMNYALTWRLLSPDIVTFEYNLDQLMRHLLLPWELTPEYDALVGPPYAFERIMGFHPKLPIRRLARVSRRHDQPAPDDLKGFEVGYEAMIQLIRGTGARPVLLTQQPSLSEGGENHRFSDERLADFISQYEAMFRVYHVEGAIRAIDTQNEIVRGLARKHEVPLVDIVGKIPREDLFYLDATHLAEPGHAIVAQMLLDRMIEDGLISP
jgi:hypothetical protein